MMMDFVKALPAPVFQFFISSRQFRVASCSCMGDSKLRSCKEVLSTQIGELQIHQI